jgi:hypothetical protein
MLVAIVREAVCPLAPTPVDMKPPFTEHAYILSLVENE